MQNRNRCDGDSFNCKRIFIDLYCLYLRNAGIPFSCKNIRKFTFDLFQHLKPSKDRHVLLLLKVKRSDIIQPSGVVLVLMGIDYRIKLGDSRSENLTSEVWTCVNYDTQFADLNIN